MNRKIAIISILVGIGLFLTSIVFSGGYDPERGFMGSLRWIQVVLVEGKFVKADFATQSYWEGRIAFPLKYALTVSIAIILSGFGYLFLSKETLSEN